MPHINRIRINNVKYNFGTQYYDDFVMRLSGKNTIYDLANGGGKSVLMLLLLQNLLPNCTLDEKQPVEKLFRGNNASTTIHSLIEWRLNDQDVKDNFRYMTTGFCARKARREEPEEGTEEENAAIEYFNYCIFYREFNDNDMKNLPLSNGKERITYNGLKAYLRELEKKDYSLKIHIFERKSEYQRFISEYGLYESEWEIIRGINKTEGHVRTYFETNYRTTRKVVEDLFIEEIIQKSFHNKIQKSPKEDMMAQTLMDIKDKLLELARKKSDIADYDRQTEVLEDFIGRVQSLSGVYAGRELLEKQLVQVYNSVSQAEKALADRRLKAAKDKLALEEKKEELARQIDTAAVQKENASKERLEAEEGLLSEELSDKKEEIQRIKEELSRKEAANQYLDYLHYQKEWQVLNETLTHLMADKGDLLSELSGLAAAAKVLISREEEKLSEELQRQEEICSKEKNDYQLLKEAERSADKELAILENSLREYEKKEQERTAREQLLRQEAGLLLGADVQELCRREKQLKQEQEETIERLVSEEAERREELQQKKLAASELSYAIAQREKELESRGAFLTREKEQSERLEALLEAYGQKDARQISQYLLNLYTELVQSIKAKENELKELVSYQQQLAEGIYGRIPSELKAACDRTRDYIERCHNLKVQAGAEYLKNLDEFNQSLVLERFPALPYSLVVDRQFEKIQNDLHMGEPSFSEYPVLVVSREALEQAEDELHVPGLCFVTKIGEMYLDSEKCQKEKDTVRAAIEKKTEELEGLCARQASLLDDMSFTQEYNTLYSPKKQEAWQEYETVRQQLKTDVQARELLTVEIRELESALSRYQERRGEEEQKHTEAEERVKLLTEVAQLEEADRKEHAHCMDARKEAEALRKSCRDMQSRLAAMESRSASREERLRNVKDELETISREWKERYEPYEKPGCEALTVESLAELRTKFEGREGALKKEFSSLEDKKRLLGNYEMAMSRAMQTIDYSGVPVSWLEQEKKNHSLVQTERDELIRAKEILKKKEREKEELEQQIRRKKEEKDRMEGSISHGIRMLVEKYGYYRECEVRDAELEQFARDRSVERTECEQELGHLEQELSAMEEHNYQMAVIRKGLNRLVENGDLDISCTSETIPDGTQITELYERYSSDYEKLLKDIYGRREEFEKEKQKLSDTLEKLNGHALAQEFRSSIQIPSRTEDTRQLIEGIRDTVCCIALEKERVGKSIKDMESIKENFVNQCLQTCENIKIELERLSRLSTIQMEGETISVISLQVPYIKEEFKKPQMERYVNELVEHADQYKVLGERLKYIRNGLSWKKLFSVIVTDMNAIKLNLYKRERIREQSRYLKYEEAVGSTGQSQGIYIQFLIGVINYIANINSARADGNGLKKVIFIDNPFGAAKDIYIWEPIFKLLKTNNVQLIVPCRGATPAITARFDVNYILGQKLIDGRQQTVVVDYVSRVEQEEMEYTAMSYEQIGLTELTENT
ncbi:MAG: hypothetical protein J6B06_04585 [Lachnospiraceae bacterium]|nr:hypothetical protein [Lachnospiraceae bacterium]